MGFFSGATGALVKGAANRMNEIIEANAAYDAAYDSEQKSLDEAQRRSQENARFTSNLNIEADGTKETNKFARLGKMWKDNRGAVEAAHGPKLTKYLEESRTYDETTAKSIERGYTLAKVDTVDANGITTSSYKDRATYKGEQFIEKYKKDHPNNTKGYAMLQALYAANPKYLEKLNSTHTIMTNGDIKDTSLLKAQATASGKGGPTYSALLAIDKEFNSLLAQRVSNVASVTGGRIKTSTVSDGVGGTKVIFTDMDPVAIRWVADVTQAARRIYLSSGKTIGMSKSLQLATDGDGTKNYPKGLGDLQEYRKNVVPIQQAITKSLLARPTKQLSISELEEGLKNAYKDSRPLVMAKLREKYQDTDSTIRELFTNNNKEDAIRIAKNRYLRQTYFRGILTRDELNDKLAKYID